MVRSQIVFIFVIGSLLVACSESPVPNAEASYTEAFPVSAPDDTEVRINACLEEAVQEGKEKFGMTDQEIALEIDGLKSDCVILIESDRRVEQAEASIAQSQARIDAANAKQAAATDEFIRQAEERRKRGD